MDSTASSGLIVNGGLIDITGSSTFESVALDNATSNGLGTLKIEAIQTLTLVQTVIKHGTVTVATTGLIDVTGTSSINKASINGAGQVKVESGQKLTLDDTTVSGTTITGADATSIVQVHDSNTLTLLGGATISGGALSVASGATLDVEGAGSPAATLGDVLVTDSGAIDIGTTSTAVLLLDGGTSISGGALTINTGSALDVETGAGASFAGVSVTNTGLVEILAGSKLVLNGTTANGAEVVTNFTGSGPSKVNGTITIDPASLPASAAILDLESASILGGLLNVYGTLDSTGTSFITDAAITVSGLLEATAGTLTIDPGTLTNSGVLEVTSGATLIIDNDVTDGATAGSLEISGTGTLELGAGVTTDESITFAGPGSGTLKLDSAFGSSGFSGTVSGLSSNDILDLDYSSSSIDLTSGTLSSFKTITLAGNSDTLTLGSNDITVTVTGTGDTVILGGGTDTVVGGSGNTVTLGAGTDTVSFSGGSNTINAVISTINLLDSLTGAGSDALVLTGGGSLSLGNLAVFTGFSTVTLNGTGESVTLKSGQNTTVNGSGSGDAVTLAVHPGTDTINFAGMTGTNTLNAVIGTSATLNSTDSLTGDGSDDLVLTGNNASLNLGSGLAAFTGFSTVTLNGTSESLTLKSGQNITVNGGGSGDAVTLAVHTGSDTIDFTKGTNTVNAVIGTNATLNSTDSLTGAGSDTLVLTGNNASLNLGTGLAAFTGFSTVDGATINATGSARTYD